MTRLHYGKSHYGAGVTRTHLCLQRVIALTTTECQALDLSSVILTFERVHLVCYFPKSGSILSTLTSDQSLTLQVASSGQASLW